MTEYTSPYRFPPLELPWFIPQETGQPTVKPIVRGASGDLTAVEPAKLIPPHTRVSSRPMQMSARIKQKYGIK